MGKYILKRVLMLIPVIIGVSLLIFVMLDLAPGNVLDMVAADYTPEQLAALEHELGYDRSVFYRYGMYMWDLLHGDLGNSYIYKAKVWDLYMQRLPSTIKLSTASVVIAIIISLPLGMRAAIKHGSLTDNASMVVALIGTSMPNFWLGLMLIIVFSLRLGWLPSGGDNDGLKSLILPALTVASGLIGTLTRTTRSSMLDVIRSDFLRTARAKGVSEKTVMRKHALKNALIPIITVIGTQLGRTLGGAVIAENAFAWPGVGRLTIDAVKQRDTITVTGCIIMSVILISAVQLLVDLAYAFVDPRIKARYTSGSKKKSKPAMAKEGGSKA